MNQRSLQYQCWRRFERAAILLLPACAVAAPSMADCDEEILAGPCPNQRICHGNISANCTSVPKLCGKCCTCPNHARRRRRAGPTKGKASKAARHSSIVGLRVALLETLLDHVIGTHAPELQLENITSRRMLRRALIQLFITKPDIHEQQHLHDQWGIEHLLRDAPRNLVEGVQRHVVCVQAKLERTSSTTASSSSSAAPASGVVGPPPWAGAP